MYMYIMHIQHLSHAQVIGWLEQGLIPLAETLQDNPSLKVSQDDVYKRLWAPPTKQYDLILIDVDHSPEDQLDEVPHAFYTKEGLF